MDQLTNRLTYQCIETRVRDQKEIQYFEVGEKELCNVYHLLESIAQYFSISELKSEYVLRTLIH